MNSLLIEQLMEIGLSQKESRLYLALVELGAASMQEIVEVSGFNRSSAYVMLELLIHKGLISSGKQDNHRIYQALPPEDLVEKSAGTVDTSTKIKALVDSLILSLYKTSPKLKLKPRILLFKGGDGISAIYENALLLKKNQVIRAFLPLPVLKTVSKLIGDGTPVKNLQCICPAQQKVAHSILPSGMLKKCRLIPETNSVSGIFIYDDKIALVSPADHFGLIIQGKDLADVMKETFDLAWRGLSQEKKR